MIKVPIVTTNMTLLSYVFVTIYYCYYYIQLTVTIIFVTIKPNFCDIRKYCHKYNSDKISSDNLIFVTKY